MVGKHPQNVKSQEKLIKITFLIIFFILIQINLSILPTLAKKKNITGFSTHDFLNPNESITYYFSNGIQFGINTNVSIDFDIQYDNKIQNREIYIKIKNNQSISFQINTKTNMMNFGLSKQPGNPNYKNNRFEYRFNCIYQFISNDSIQNLTIQFNKTSNFGLNPNKTYFIAVFELSNESWQIIPTEELINELSSESYLETTILNLEGNTEYYITLYEVSISSDIWPWILIIVIIVVIATLGLAITKKDYINYLKNRLINIDKGAHRLTIEEVLENENRNKIIDLILSNPGVHFNELLRQTGIAAGNLVWHLDILETYKIIGKKRIGNYIAYFPYYNKNPISNIDLKLQKSKFTLEVLEMIERNPGIYNNLITKKFRVDHKTIHYHLKKLFDLGIIYSEKIGRKKQLFPNLDSEYYNSK